MHGVLQQKGTRNQQGYWWRRRATCCMEISSLMEAQRYIRLLCAGTWKPELENRDELVLVEVGKVG